MKYWSMVIYIPILQLKRFVSMAWNNKKSLSDPMLVGTFKKVFLPHTFNICLVQRDMKKATRSIYVYFMCDTYFFLFFAGRYQTKLFCAKVKRNSKCYWINGLNCLLHSQFRLLSFPCFKTFSEHLWNWLHRNLNHLRQCLYHCCNLQDILY